MTFFRGKKIMNDQSSIEVGQGEVDAHFQFHWNVVWRLLNGDVSRQYCLTL